MPIHDWTRVDAGLFHDFHQSWTVALRDALNMGVLPPDYFALVEQHVGGPIPDVLTLSLGSAAPESPSDAHTHAVATAPPRMAAARGNPSRLYARKANRITVRHRHGRVVAMIEVVSPGNKSSRAEFRAFVEKTAELLQQGVHILVIDLFPPGPRDPNGIHKAIWEEFEGEELQSRPGKSLTLASYDASSFVAYVESVAVGDALPDMPLFLQPEQYVPAPLEASYMASWSTFPAALKGLLE
jgi:Protein of unknown function (DUF4058)